MPEEAFALSPISARPSLPSEADYEAIREAFMETARGRWFLSEYAKRNRNADTRMVLDAVERIEQSLSAQKQSASTGLVDALGAISALITETKSLVAEALPDPADTLAPARDGARITREVATALRQCGADVRICDLLDAQVDAIDAGHQQIAANAPRQAVLAAFDRLLQGVVDLASSNGAPTAPAARAEPPQAQPPRAAAPPAAPPSAAPEAFVAVEPEADRAADDLEFAEPSEAAMAETAAAPAADDAFELPAEADEFELDDGAALAGSTSERAPYETDATTAPTAPTLEQIVADEAALDAEAAEDFAILDMVAQEMSITDDDDLLDYDRPESPVQTPAPAPAAVATSAQAAPQTASPQAPSPQAASHPAAPAPFAVAETAAIEAVALSSADDIFAAPVAEPARPAVMAAAAPAIAPTGFVAPAAHAAPVAHVAPAAQVAPPPAAAPAPAAPASLGAAVLAHGVVRKAVVASDPLAALRRMTQAEKLAFFS